MLKKSFLLLRQRFNSSKSPEHYSLGGKMVRRNPHGSTAVDPSGLRDVS